MLTVKKKKGSKVSNMRTAEVFIAMQGTLDIPYHLSKILDKSGISWHAFLPSSFIKHTGMASSNILANSFDQGTLFLIQQLHSQ